MTELSREAILGMQPGRELDALITTKVMGLGQWHTFSELQKPYSTDIGAAWEVVEIVKSNWVFSNRLRYFKHLTEIIYSKNGIVVGWPDALMFMEPYHLCKAALLTTLEEENR